MLHSQTLCPDNVATVFELRHHSRRATTRRGAMAFSGGSFQAAEAFVKSFVLDGDSVTFDRTALEGLRVR